MPNLHTPIDWLKVIARNAKRIVVFLLGVAVAVAGIAMLVLPGPGVIVLLLGLIILATEFVWAERVLDATTTRAAEAATRVSDRRSARVALAVSGTAMIVGGIVVAIVFDPFVVVGISVAVAGVVALITLLPPVQAWIAGKSEAQPGVNGA